MADEVKLLKHGKPVTYRRCDLCSKYSRWLSPRGWCDKCEDEFKNMKRPAT